MVDSGRVLSPPCKKRRLEGDLGSQLPPSRERLGGRNAKVALGKIPLDVLEIGMVEQVVEFKPELEVEPLGYVRIFVKIHIRLHEGRIPEPI